MQFLELLTYIGIHQRKYLRYLRFVDTVERVTLAMLTNTSREIDYRLMDLVRAADGDYSTTIFVFSTI